VVAVGLRRGTNNIITDPKFIDPGTAIPNPLFNDLTELNTVTTGGVTTLRIPKDAMLTLSLNTRLSMVGGDGCRTASRV
jgi:hypothetical protein